MGPLLADAATAVQGTAGVDPAAFYAIATVIAVLVGWVLTVVYFLVKLKRAIRDEIKEWAEGKEGKQVLDERAWETLKSEQFSNWIMPKIEHKANNSVQVLMFKMDALTAKIDELVTRVKDLESDVRGSSRRDRDKDKDASQR